MQWNQSYPAGYEYNPFKPHQTISIYPKVIGEGDVTSVLFPDGSIQSFFVPVTARQDRWSPYPYNVPNWYGHCQDPNPDYWFVRSISYPNPTAIYQAPNICGEPLAPTLRNSYCCIQPCQEYHQKFHNDSFTSTTDLCYFYPRLCRDRPFKFNEAIQTEFLNTCCNKGTYERPPKETCKCDNHGSASSGSHMSIDGDTEITCNCSRRKKKNKKKSKNDVQCKCNKQSDKCVTTYVDQASGTAADENVLTSKKKKSKRQVKIRSISKNSSKTANTSCECSHSSCACDTESD